MNLDALTTIPGFTVIMLIWIGSGVLTWAFLKATDWLGERNERINKENEK